MSHSGANPAPRSRSMFVTVVAWVFIALAGFAALIAIMQAVMYAFIFSAGELPPAAGASRELEEMPAPFRFVVQNIWLFFAAFWSLTVLTLVAAIGLLLRKNWARLTFIALMGIGIAWNLGAIWLQQVMVSSMPTALPRAPAEIASGFDTIATGMGMALFGVVFAVIFGWVAVRLMSPSVKTEFKTH